jgi:hypothetical protein
MRYCTLPELIEALRDWQGLYLEGDRLRSNGQRKAG